MDCKELFKSIQQNRAPKIIDVRSTYEFDRGHISGAIHLPLVKFFLRLSSPPEDKHADYVIVCEHGPRAQMVKTALMRRGYTNVELLDGHMHSWRAHGFPLK